jgi:hypothetical protein
MHRTQTCSPQHAISLLAMPLHLAPSRETTHSRSETPSVHLHRDHTSPASIPNPPLAPTRLPSHRGPFAHFSALFSLHLLAREAAQASVVPARRAESFQRGPPFRSSGLGSAIRISKEGKQASTAQRKTRQCTDLLLRDHYWCRHFCAYRITLLAASLAGRLLIDFSVAGTAP